jgi:hypothetical protein
MRLLKQPNDQPNCLVYAAAMLLDASAENILKHIGHDGQEEWWPEAEGNAKKRGVHIQEIIDYALEMGICICPIELYPRSAPFGFEKSAKMIWSENKCLTRFNTWLQFHSAILILSTHAVTWDAETHKVFDPNGLIREIDDLQVIEAWVLLKSNLSGKVNLEF